MTDRHDECLRRMHTDSMSLMDGDEIMAITYPSQVSADELHFIKGWLDVFVTKMERRVIQPGPMPKSPPTTNADQLADIPSFTDARRANA